MFNIKKFHVTEYVQFAAALAAAGGSGDVSADLDATTAPDLSESARSLGRYARQYVLGPPANHPAAGPVAGRTATFYCGVPGGSIVLEGVPFATNDEVNYAYRMLAAAGARPNDRRPEDEEPLEGK